MTKRLLLVLCALALLLPAASAQDDDKPTIAVLRFGTHLSYGLVETALVDALAASELVNDDEWALLTQGEDLSGERINLIWSDANFDFANANTIVENAIDQGADVLITLSTPVTQAATLITSDMDDPPAVIFTSVYNPLEAGIAKATCVKPAHVTGIESRTAYEDIVPLLLLQNPDIKTIGTLYSTSETSGREGAKRIVAAADSLGLEVLQAGVNSAAELGLAAEGLASNGAEALLIPSDMTTAAGLPAIMQVATDNGLPIFHTISTALYDGATVTAGTSESLLQGGALAALLAGHLDGSVDIAAVGIGLINNLVVGVNLDTAAEQGITVSDDLMDLADQVMQDGEFTSLRMVNLLKSKGMDDETVAMLIKAAQSLRQGGASDLDLSPELQAMVKQAIAAGGGGADIDALLTEMHCSDEMIAEQQAALAAAGG